MKSLQEIVKELIELKQEGAYWDFKRQWYGKSKKDDMLLDIICMSNNLVNKDAYIIIGVDEEDDYTTIDVSSDEDRRTTENIVSFLRTKEFAGEIRPRVTVETVFIESNAIDVIVIHNSNDTPYYLKKKSGKVRPYNIYTRVQDTNTPCDSSADIHNVELLWKKRFGMLLTPLEKCKMYLKDKENWVQKDYYNEIMHYKLFPEFTIETDFETEKYKDGYEYYMFNQIDMDTISWASVYIKYYQTVLFQTFAVCLDGGRYFAVVPDLEFVKFSDRELLYAYMIKDDLKNNLNELFFNDTDITERRAHNVYMNGILVFESEKEKVLFEKYVQDNWDDSCEKMLENIRQPLLPNDGLDYDYMVDQYKKVQVMQKMLREYRLG